MHSAPKLVGRHSQLQWLLRSLDEAAAGWPRVVWIRGAPGIGKSRIARELATRATSRGVDVHYGRCQERLTLPYLPFEESLFPRLRQMLETERGGAPASDVVRRVLGQAPEIPQAPSFDLLAEAEAARREQTRLLLELTSLTMRLAQHRPALLVVDDFHWADQASFDFLVQLGLRLADARLGERIPLLLVIAARPELDERYVSALERLEQETICSRVDLEGLDRFETAELVRQLDVAGITPELAESLNRATGGNPLFLENAIRAVVRHGTSAQPESLGFEAGRLPLGEISDAIAERLAHLGASCRHVLTVASLLGADCAINEVQSLTQLSAEGLAEALDEAQEQGIVEIRNDRLFFPHPLYHAELYSAATPGQRRQLHASIASLLQDELATEGDRRQPELAGHLIAAGREAEPQQVFDHAVAAGDRASALFAWVEATRLYQVAVEASGRCDPRPDDRTMARVLYTAGVSSELAIDIEAACAFLDLAAERMERLGDQHGLVQVQAAKIRCLLSTSFSVAFAAGRRDARVEIEVFERLLDRLGPEEQAERAHGLANLAQWRCLVEGRFDEARTVAKQAIALAREVDSPLGQVRGAVSFALAEMIELNLKSSLAHFDQGVAVARAHTEPALVWEASNRRPLIFFWLGRLREASAAAQEAVEEGRRLNDPVHNLLPTAALASINVARGQFDEAECHAHDALLVQRLSGYSWASGVFFGALVAAHARRGAWKEAGDALDLWRSDSGGGGTLSEVLLWLHRQYLRASAGDLEIARAQLQAHPERIRARPGPLLGSASWCCSLIELAALLDEPDLAEVPTTALADVYERGQVFTSGLLFHIPRVLGVAGRLRGDLDEAVALLEWAVAEADEMGARADHALALLDLARALTDRGDAGERAFRTASAARDELATLCMNPFTKSADRLLERLAESGATPHPGLRVKDASSGTYTMLFSDMEGSTALTRRLGDLKARDIIREHHEIVRAQLAAYGGTEVEAQGDGFLIAFGGARDALLCAIGIQRALRTHNESSAVVTIRVRIGLHTGEAIREGRKFFGLSVILASRIAAQAQPGEILISGVVHSLTQTAGDIHFGPERDVPLKGFAAPERIVEVFWE